MSLRRAAAILVVSLVGREACGAQSQPASIPLPVALAVSGYFSAMFGRPEYAVAKTPPGWPAALVPPDARIIGGGIVGQLESIRIHTAVFELPADADLPALTQAIARRGGYALRPSLEEAPGGEGFLSSPSKARPAVYCRGVQSLLSTEIVDSTVSKRVIALHVLSGEVARQNCDASSMRERMRSGSMRFGPSNLPTLHAPSGVAAFPSGSSWSGSSGENRTTLRTTMPVDSILAHYTTQLVAAGWKTDGSQLANRSVGLQKFTFKEGEEPWSAALIIMAVGDRRDMGLRLSRVNSEY